MNFKIKSTAGLILVVTFLALAAIFFPLLVIWSLNTLFPVLNIPFTIETWLAAFIIPAAFKTSITTNKDDK